ncbi:ABC transporter 1 [Abeliophyllum distichum]|uniref:ABC transporter 1 n=1 Tax=Abeliophyllum distichum TaxID=126358 RepID=A0ABD1TD15_9LAMI
MVSWKDITRVVKGLSLVAQEAVRRSETGELQSLIKAGILSGTDLAGLTKGRLRRFDTPNALNTNSDALNRNNKVSAVHFRDDYPPSKPSSDSNAITAATAQSEGAQSAFKADAEADLDAPYNNAQSASPSNEGDSSDAVVSGAITPQPPLQKQRKPRERRVPSTPFSRALGFAGLGAGLAWGTLQESAKRIVFGAPVSQNNQRAISPFLSEKNAERGEVSGKGKDGWFGWGNEVVIEQISGPLYWVVKGEVEVHLFWTLMMIDEGYDNEQGGIGVDLGFISIIL